MAKDDLRIAYFKKYLEVAPLSHALWRSFEVAEIAKEELLEPLIDIGCGSGEFAGVFYDRKVEIGIDISKGEILKVRRKKLYKKIKLCDARNMPFADNTFQTAISISVLEHISKVEEAIRETIRILKPGGKFIFTVPLKTINKELFYPKILEKLGLKNLAKIYRRTLNGAFSHVNLLGKEDWEKMVQNCGANIIEERLIVPKRVVRLWDLVMPLAALTQINKKFFGRRIPFNIPGRITLLTFIFKRVMAIKDKDGCNLLIIALKPKKAQ